MSEILEVAGTVFLVLMIVGVFVGPYILAAIRGYDGEFDDETFDDERFDVETAYQKAKRIERDWIASLSEQEKADKLRELASRVLRNPTVYVGPYMVEVIQPDADMGPAFRIAILGRGDDNVESYQLVYDALHRLVLDKEMDGRKV